MKRFFSLLLSVVMLFSMVAILPVAAEDVACLHTDASVVNKTYITGGVVLSDYECTCGETWTEDEQGTTYTSVTTGCPPMAPARPIRLKSSPNNGSMTRPPKRRVRRKT